jgi:hypothetical protein
LRNRTRGYLSRLHHGFRLVLVGLAEAIRTAVRAYHERPRPIPIEVLVADRARGRTIERDLGAGLRRLRRALGRQLPNGVAVVVQQVICTDRQIAGCFQLARRPDGADLALVRLALQVDGRPLPTDELLSVLAEQYIGLAVHQAGGAGVLVPVELEPERRPVGRRVDGLRADPLAPAPTPTCAAGSQLTRAS